MSERPLIHISNSRRALIAVILLIGLLPIYRFNYSPAGPRPDQIALRWVDGPAQISWSAILIEGFADVGPGQISVSIPGCCETYSLAWLPVLGIVKWENGDLDVSISVVLRGQPRWRQTLIGIGPDWDTGDYRCYGLWAKQPETQIVPVVDQVSG